MVNCVGKDSGQFLIFNPALSMKIRGTLQGISRTLICMQVSNQTEPAEELTTQWHFFSFEKDAIQYKTLYKYLSPL